MPNSESYSLWELLSGSVKFDFVLSNPATSDQSNHDVCVLELQSTCMNQSVIELVLNAVTVSC
jgi:hypothetical protein